MRSSFSTILRTVSVSPAEPFFFSSPKNSRIDIANPYTNLVHHGDTEIHAFPEPEQPPRVQTRQQAKQAAALQRDIRPKFCLRLGCFIGAHLWFRNELYDARSWRTSETLPVIADAAAVSGLAKNVRPPFPCRPSKLRLLVLIQYCPGCSSSPFMAIHMLHPGSRHSAPASRKILCSPSLSAADFTA